MKKYKIFIYILLCSVLIACTETNKDVKTPIDENKNIITENAFCSENCRIADMSGYSINSDNFYNITYKDALNYLKGKTFTGIIYFGFEGCPWCYEAVPVLDEVATESDIMIYYVDKSAENSDYSEDNINKILTELSKDYDVDVDEDGNPRLYYPTVIAVKEGIVVAHNVGTIEGHNAHERAMTNEEREILENLYVSMISNINTNSN